MVGQHLQPGLQQGIEFPSLWVVNVSLIGRVLLGGSGYPFSLALTSLVAIFLALVRLRHGLGILFISSWFGLRVVRIDLVSRSGVYLRLRNVSYVLLVS